MSENNNLCIVSVREILDDNLIIPVYQRPYRWSTESALTLVSDTYSAFQNKVSEYRIGSVVLHKKDEEMNVVDGQQRLTTLSIMLYCFYKRTKNEEYRNMSKLFNAEYNELSTRAIIDNLETITRKISEIDDVVLERYISYVLNECTLVKIVTDSEQEAFQFFDSQNSRGKELAPHDLLKSYHLREMHGDSESEKVQIINLWENTSQKKLGLLFEKNLFPLVKWYKTQDGLNYSVKDIKTFKGIKKNNNYNFSVYNRAANLYIERFNDEGMYELTSGKRVNQFQLTQPLIAGKRFFQYSLYYADLYDMVEEHIDFKFKDIFGNKVYESTGDGYVKTLFINVVMFYIDKFNFDALTDSRLKFFFRWAYSLRLTMKAVYKESVNNYAQGKGDRVNRELNMFSAIAEMQDPMELDTIILESIPYKSFKDSKINEDKYKPVYEKLFGKEGHE